MNGRAMIENGNVEERHKNIPSWTDKSFVPRFVDQVDYIAALALPINVEKHFIRRKQICPDILINSYKLMFKAFQSQKTLLGFKNVL